MNLGADCYGRYIDHYLLGGFYLLTFDNGPINWDRDNVSSTLLLYPADNTCKGEFMGRMPGERIWVHTAKIGNYEPPCVLHYKYIRSHSISEAKLL